MTENPTVRVFVSSPSDVRPERLIVERVVKRLAREFSYHFRLEAVLWEREPLLATHHFQDLIVPPGWTNRFHHGNRWVLTRQAAEAIKREIFQFRTGAASYRDEVTREKDLAKAIEDVTRRLAHSEANTTALLVYNGSIPPLYAAGEGDDGMSPLTPECYLKARLDDQLKFFRKKAVTLDTLLERLQWGILGVGGLGTLLVAIGLDLWVTLTTAIATALGTYLTYRGVDSTLTNYNQTAIDLENIKGWWTALRPDEQGDPGNVHALVQHTEQVLATELSGWTQRMQDTLANLSKDQEKKPGEPAEAKEVKPAKTADVQEKKADDVRAAGAGLTPLSEGPRITVMRQ
jgi:hypothetical protein